MDDNKKEISISGEITRVKYRSSENWSVFSFVDEHVVEHNATGILPGMCDIGSEITVTGEMVTDSMYGKQIKASKVVPKPPDTSSDKGVTKILMRLPGIGPKKAEMFVAKHGGKKAFELALDDPCSVGVREVNKDNALNILKSLLDDSKAFIFLAGIGISDLKAERIIKQYGAEKAIDIVSTNPYQMIDDIHGFGFVTVDKMALGAGISVDNKNRLFSCIVYCLNESEVNNGNTYIEGWDLCGVVTSILVDSAGKCGVSIVGSPGKKEIQSAVYSMAKEGKVVVENGLVFSKELLDAEQFILMSIDHG